LNRNKRQIVSIGIGFRGDPKRYYVRIRYSDGTTEESDFDPTNPIHLRALKEAQRPDPPFGGKSRAHAPTRAGGHREGGSPPRQTPLLNREPEPPPDHQPPLFPHNDLTERHHPQ
jgi:hypothetical protein